MALNRQALLPLPLRRPIQRTEPAIQVPVEEKHHAVAVPRVAVDDPVHAAGVGAPGPLGQHVAHVDDVGGRVRRDGHEGARGRVEDFEAGVLVLQQERDGAEVGVCAGAQLTLFAGAGGGGGVVQESEGRGGGAGCEGLEDVGAVGEGAGDEGEDVEA